VHDILLENDTAKCLISCFEASFLVKALQLPLKANLGTARSPSITFWYNFKNMGITCL